MAQITSRAGELPGGARPTHLSRRAFVGAGLALLVSSTLPREAAAAPAELSIVDESSTPMPPVATAPVDTVTAAPTVLTVPYRSQLDGSRQAKANCGPACLSMLLSLYGDGTAIGDLRFNINQYMKVWSASNGSSWEALANAAAMRRFRIIGLLKSPGLCRRWSVDDLLAETARGNPVMILTRYKYLPGHENTYVQYNHYVVVVGADAAGSIIYHDPAYLDGASGAYRAMTREQLNAAWSTVSSGIIYSGMAIRPADGK